MIDTKEKEVYVSDTILDMNLSYAPEMIKDSLPAPVTPKTVPLEKEATSVNFDIVLYLQDGFIASSIKTCIEVIVDPTGEKTEKRVIHITYDFTNKKDDLFKPHVYNLTIPDIGLDKEEVKLTFYLVNEDPVTSRGTTTTVKREM